MFADSNLIAKNGFVSHHLMYKKGQQQIKVFTLQSQPTSIYYIIYIQKYYMLCCYYTINMI